MKKLWTKLVALALGVAMALGVGFAISRTSKASMVSAASPQTLTTNALSGTSSDGNIGWSSAKGSAANAPAIYNSGIRLYQNGCFIQLEGKNGVKINSFTAHNTNTYATTANYAVSESAFSTASTPANAGTNTSVAKSGTYTISGLDSTYVAIICRGSDKNSRFEVSSIDVSYTGGSSAVVTTTTLSAAGDKVTLDLATASDSTTVSAVVKDNTSTVISGASVEYSVAPAGIISLSGSSLSRTVTADAVGTATITASYAGVTDTYQPSSGTIDIEVIDSSVTFVTFVCGTDSGTTTTLSKTPITISVASGDGDLSRSDQYRIYSGKNVIFASSGDPITKIEVVCSSDGYNTLSGSGYVKSSENGTWTGSSNSVSLTASGGQTRMTSITVYFGGEAPVGGHSITFNENAGGDTVTNMPSTLTNQSGTVSLEGLSSPSRSGYTFSGWSLSASGAIVTSVTVDDSDIELFAIWAEVVEEYHLDYTAGTHGQDCTVNGHVGIKFGTGSADGDMTITIPSGVTKIKLYIAAWKGAAGTVTLSGAATETLSATADDGISGSSLSFTLNGTESIFKFEVSVTSGTLTITSGSAHRFVVWGATDLFAESYASEFTTKITCNSAGTSEPTYASGYNWLSFRSIYNNLDAEEKGRLVSPDNQTLLDATARYDYIVGKYNPTGETDPTKTNYAHYITGRTVTPLGSARVLFDTIGLNPSNNIAVIIIISCIALSALSLFLIIKKKKYNN